MATRTDRVEADFVVVGAGSAGCAVAARLSEDTATRVVLLEAGGEDKNRWIHIPLGFGKTFADPSVNWCYQTEPDPGAADRRVFWPRGKVLGGSSSINGMVYIRGQAEDFDHWRQLGNTGWSFEDVLPYFRRSEHQVRGADAFHGMGGPLCVSDVEPHPICEAFIAVTTQLGFVRNDDFNGASQDGVGYHQTTTRNGRRCSTAVGYLRPAMQRPNLRVITEALTEKILFEGCRATGVTFHREGRICTATAAREVILCGGAVNSPQLLMLSGIGPQEHLAGFGLSVVHHLPGVGQSLQDHYSAPIKLKCALPVTVNDVMLSNARKLKAGLQYYMFHRGPLSMISSPAALFARTRPELASPDIKCSLSPFSAERPQDGLHPWSGFTMIAYQLRPESCGEIKLRSPDPADAPAVHPNYLASETDQRTIVAGLKLCRQILENPHLKPFIASEFQPGPAVESDEQLLDYARRRGGTVYHPTSTCKMGGDPLAVVDAELRVHGIGGLRVADASIMPTVVSGNTNAATIMIGEKAADMARQPMRLAAQGLRASEHIPGCLIEKDPPLLFAWRGRATQLFAQIHPSLHRRALLDRVAPAGDVGELVERLAERFGDQHPWPARHIGYRVVVEGEVAVSEAAFEHTETAVVLVGIALAGIRMLTLSVIDEVAELPGHRTEIADLPEQPLQALFAGAPALRHEPPGPLGEMDQDRARLEHRQRPVAKLLWGVVVDNRRHAVIRADRQEFGLELVAATDIYRDHAEVEAALLEHDRDLPAVRGRPIVKVDHVLPPELNSAISAVE